MNLINQHVTHKTLGQGIIILQDDRYITVEFTTKTSRFIYPDQDTFSKFLTLEDSTIHLAVLKETENAKIAAKNALFQAQEEKRKAEEAQAKKQALQEVDVAACKSHKSSSHAKSVKSKEVRVLGKPITFFVFQGSTYNIESAGGFIWAPKHSQSGGNVFHWDNMLLVKEGDIILHGCNGYIVAVSTAISNCYDFNRSGDRTFEDSWNNDGRRVDLKYTTFLNPIKTSNFTDEILKYCKAKYSPFDKNGNGNMGYLYELDRELSRIFLRAAARINPGLFDLDYVKNLLAESYL